MALAGRPGVNGISLVTTLVDVLDAFIMEGKLEPQRAHQAIAVLSKILDERFNALVERTGLVTITAQLHSYNLCDEVWTFALRDVDLQLVDSYMSKGRDHRVRNSGVRVEKVKIVYRPTRHARDDEICRNAWRGKCKKG